MKSVKEQFVRSIRSWLSVPESGDLANERGTAAATNTRMTRTEAAPSWRGRLHEWVMRPENRRALLLSAWIIGVLLMLFVTGIVQMASALILKTYKPGLVIAAVLWAVFFGTLILFLFPSKLVTTTFGGLLGIGASQLTSGASLLSAADTTILKASEQLRQITGIDGSFVHVLLWIFVAVLTLICLPAFFRD